MLPVARLITAVADVFRAALLWPFSQYGRRPCREAGQHSILRAVGWHQPPSRHVPGLDGPACAEREASRPMTSSAAEVDRGYTADEIMSVTAARALAGARTCFVGIGLPSTAANLARRVHEPGLVLIYESGTIGAKPSMLPLSIGDQVSSPITASTSGRRRFRRSSPLLVQGGLVRRGASSGQPRSTASRTSTRPRSAEGPAGRRSGCPALAAPRRIAAHARRVVIVVRHSRRVFVDRLDYVTTLGHGRGRDDRARDEVWVAAGRPR